MPELYNIKQITKHDLTGSDIPETVTIGDTGVTLTVNYREFILPEAKPAIKFGYCCNTNSGIILPIYLMRKDSDTYDLFYIGKTGMFEWQPEDWEDVNDENEPLQTAECPIKQFKLPYSVTSPAENQYEIDFVLDYCC